MENSPFQGVVNKSVIDEDGRSFIRVKHGNRIYRVDIATSDDDLEAVRILDNRYFTGAQKISMDELKLLRTFGDVLMFRNPENDRIEAFSQILYSSIPQQEVRMHEAFSYGTAGRGFGQVMFKATEVRAREANKHRIRLTVRTANTETVRALFKAGYRIRAFDPTRYGAAEAGGGRLVMEKDLINEQFPFDPARQAKLFKQGNFQVVQNAADLASELNKRPEKIALYVHHRHEVELDAHQLIYQVMLADYFGIGLLQSEEIELKVQDPTRKLLVFQRSDLPPWADRLRYPVQVDSELGRLREVIVSYTPENAQIKEEYAINDVARQNVNNIDPIAFKDEYNLFVGTLVEHNVRIVHTNAIGKEGKSAIFTRDPAYTIGDTFVMGLLGQQQRVYETEGMRQISENRRTMMLTDDPDAVTEGGDIIFIGEKKLAVGIGQRTNMAGFEKLKNAFPDYEFIPVPHKDLHLDVLFTMVGNKKCLADVTQLPADFIQRLREDGYTVIEADPAEQVTLGCNVVALDDGKVIAVKENAETNRRLRKNGVTVIEVSMPNVVKWGGGPRCMTCPTHRE